MNLYIISREKLEYVAKRILNYPLHDAEKDYFLTIVMQMISNSALSEKLVSKGGTAIYHCFLEQLRFSEDLDFTATNKEIKMADLKRLFKKYDIFEIKKEYVSDATLKIERLKYTGVLDTPNSVKIEVDKQQNVYLPSLRKRYKNVWGLDFEVNVMDPIEICAEKIRACNDRFRYRDYYDLYLMVNKLGIDIRKAVETIPKKEIRKKINKKHILRNLRYALKEVSEKADTVIYKEEIKDNCLVEFFKKLYIPDFNPNV